MQWVIDNIGSQRLLDKILRMVATQSDNVKTMFQNKYDRGCGNRAHALTEVSFQKKNLCIQLLLLAITLLEKFEQISKNFENFYFLN